LWANALSNKCGAICFTYNEPIIYYEYVMDVAEICKSKNIDFIIKTNGFAEKSIWKDMCRVSSAVNIDWKGNETKYREIAKAFGVPVLESIEYAVENTHLEISVPVYHDDKIEDHIEFSSFMKRFINVPIHLLKLYPAYKQLVNITSDALVKNIKNVYSSSRYVYVQNIFEEGLQDSFCPVCYKLVASRKSLYTELHYDSCCNLSIIKV
jgi:pyruvate formate lyase activating enzyme